MTFWHACIYIYILTCVDTFWHILQNWFIEFTTISQLVGHVVRRPLFQVLYLKPAAANHLHSPSNTTLEHHQVPRKLLRQHLYGHAFATCLNTSCLVPSRHITRASSWIQDDCITNWPHTHCIIYIICTYICCQRNCMHLYSHSIHVYPWTAQDRPHLDVIKFTSPAV